MMPESSLVWAVGFVARSGTGAWKIGMRKPAKTRMVWALMSSRRSNHGLVGIIALITISLVVTEDTT